MAAEQRRTWFNAHPFVLRHGLMLGNLSPEQRRLALDVVRATLSAGGYDQARDIMRLNGLLATLTASPAEFGAVRAGQVRAHLDETWFSWLGGTAGDEPFYYRIHSPVVLVELDQQPGVVLDIPEPSRHHIHTIIRTPNGGDYGADLLARHHARFDHSLSEQAAT